MAKGKDEMEESLQNQFWGMGKEIIGYLPNLFAGILLVVVGWFLGWFLKRIIIRVAVLLRLERFLTKMRWGEDFSKGDVRFGFYNFLGNIAFFVIFIIFLDNAFRTWKLTVLSDLLEKIIYFFPKILLAVAMFGIGWLIASWAARSASKALHREDIPRASLIARLIKAVLITLFSAMALVELDIARQVVIIGFVTIFVTSGILMIVITAIGGKEFIRKIKKSLEEK
jgi:Mechanosensitive ion channel, conserved TM helix